MSYTDLRWLVRIADQDSAIISTDYDKPTIHHVGLQNPSNPNDPTELSSRGGEVIILSGMCVFCSWPCVTHPVVVDLTPECCVCDGQQLWPDTGRCVSHSAVQPHRRAHGRA